jgi:uncharacterized protein YkwD
MMRPGQVSWIALTCLALLPPAAPAQQHAAPLEGPIIFWTNHFRQQKGLHPLQVDPKLTYAARMHAYHMAVRETMAHELDGSTPVDRVRHAGYEYRAVAENVAWCEGYADPAWQLFTGWMHSPGHYRNLMGPQYTQIGVGVYRSRSGQFYACQVFGTPLPPALPAGVGAVPAQNEVPKVFTSRPQDAWGRVRHP